MYTKLDYPEEFLQCKGLTCNWETLGAEPDNYKAKGMRRATFGIRIWARCTTCSSLKYMIVSKVDPSKILQSWKYFRVAGYKPQHPYSKADFRAAYVEKVLKETKKSDLSKKVAAAERKVQRGKASK